MCLHRAFLSSISTKSWVLLLLIECFDSSQEVLSSWFADNRSADFKDCGTEVVTHETVSKTCWHLVIASAMLTPMGSTATLDLDAIALIRKPRPWGWFIAGLLAIGASGFVLGYYVPLRSAHHLIAKEHESLAKKSAELNHALVQTKAELETAAGKLRTLEVAERERVRRERSRADEYEAISGLIQQGAKALVAAKVLTVTSSPAEATASLPMEVAFPHGAKAVAPSLAKSLCAIGKSAKERPSLQLELELAVPGTLDAPMQTLLASQEGSLTSMMVGACKVPAERLRVTHFALKSESSDTASVAGATSVGAAASAAVSTPAVGAGGKVTFRYRSLVAWTEGASEKPETP